MLRICTFPLFSFLALAALGFSACAGQTFPNSGTENGSMQGGWPVPDSENIKSSKGFGAQLWVIDDERFFDDWNRPEIPTIPVTRTAVRYEPVYVIILFLNPGLGNDSLADVTADITIRGPDGGVYGEFHDIEVWKRPYLAPQNSIQLAAGTLAIEIEEQDLLGRYTVEATVKDWKKNVSLRLQTSFLALAEQGIEI